MTPISALIARFVPPVLRVPVLALVYAAMVAAVVLAARVDYGQIIYVDVRAP